MSFVAAEVGRHTAGERPLLSLVAEGIDRPTSLAKGWTIADLRMEGVDSRETIVPQQHQAVIIVLAPPENQKTAPQSLREGVRDIANHCHERPADFSDAALRALRRVAQSVGRKIRITLSAGQGEGQSVALDEALARHIDGWLSGQSASIGTVEGKLELISIHNKLRFTIYGRDGLRVECLFPETMLAQVKSALGERVCLRGRIRYRRDGKPATVEAQYLKTLSLSAQTPIPKNFWSGDSGVNL
ncbi:hypothetical protein EON80_01180 [bacterium]|nr:MAG: hypothetical protein EON80_01180 [bacterium]